MKVYIFKEVEQLTDNYHEGGGLVVVAKDKEHVKELIKWANEYDKWDETHLKDAEIALTEKEWEGVIVYPTNDDAKANVFVFPDAGCC